MSKQDRQGVRSPTDIERKYDLAAIAVLKKASKNSEEGINKINATLTEFVALTLGTFENMQNQIDGNITTHFYSGVPTLGNAPTSEWGTDEEKNNHLGDLYYNKDTGAAYRFMLDDTQYVWERIKDDDIAEALALANAAKDTADGKRRVFTEQPVPPYDNGDLWFKEQEIYICQISKAEGQVYEEKDFIIATKYTDDTEAKKVGSELEVVKGTVKTIEEGVDSFKQTIEQTTTAQGQQIAKNKTSIEQNAEAIKTKVAKGNVSSEISQEAGEINIKGNRIIIISDKFKLNADGTITATDGSFSGKIVAVEGNIGGWKVGEHGLYNDESQMGMLTNVGDTGIFYAGMTYEDIIDLAENGSDHYPAFMVTKQGNMYLTSLNIIGDPEALNAMYVSGNAEIWGNVWANSYNNLSLEEKKKNFEKFENGLNVLQDIDIYKFNYKSETDETKKHIGFVIGEDYKYSKIVTSNDNTGADVYSLVSVCVKAIQELNAEIQMLKEKQKERSELDG